MTDQSNFWGDLIRQLRAERRIAQRTLAIGVRMNRSTVRNIEDGKNRDIRRIEAVLDYFGYDLEAMNREEQKTRQQQHDMALSAPN